MKRPLILFSLCLALCLALTAAPPARAAECVSPDGRHHYSLVDAWTEGSSDCEYDLYRIYECLYCTDWYYTVETHNDHSFGSWVTTKAATCASTGTSARTCSKCGKRETRTLPATAHTWGAETIIVEATDHSAGTKRRTCSVCGTVNDTSYDPEGTLRRGAQGEAVKELQQLLADQGFLNGAVDGAFGGGTESAVKAFQTSAGLTADGVAWPQTINRLRHNYGDWKITAQPTAFSAGARERVCLDCGFVQTEQILPEGTLRPGDKGDAVKALQEALSGAGYDVGTPDGAYGAKTEQAVKAYQSATGLTADGIAWPGVMAKLGIPGYEAALQTEEAADAEEPGCALYVTARGGNGAEYTLVPCEKHASWAADGARMAPADRLAMWQSACVMELSALKKGADDEALSGLFETENELFEAWVEARQARLAAEGLTGDEIAGQIGAWYETRCAFLCLARHRSAEEKASKPARLSSPDADACAFETEASDQGTISRILLCSEHRMFGSNAARSHGPSDPAPWLDELGRLYGAAPSDLRAAESECADQWLKAQQSLTAALWPKDPARAYDLQMRFVWPLIAELCGEGA